MRLRYYIVLATLILAMPGLNSSGCSEPIPESGGDAAIIDQLYSIHPNPDFTNAVTDDLENCGFNVRVHRGEEVTVDFYRGLPAYGYRLIIFRVHSGLLMKKGQLRQDTWMFTGEPYNRAKHVSDRLAGRIVKARTAEDQPWVFAVGSKFVTESIEEEFDHTVIIMMGCYCFYLEDLARAFTEKGASVYIGWDGNVTLDYVDRATVHLIQNLCRDGMEVKQATGNTVEEIGPDPDWDTSPRYYPEYFSDFTLNDLIRLD